MNDKLGDLLYSAFEALYYFALKVSPFSGIAIGVGLFGIWACREGNSRFGLMLFLSILGGGVVLGPLAWWGFPELVALLLDHQLMWPLWYLYAYAGGAALGIAAVWVWFRHITPKLDAFVFKSTRKSGTERNSRTDIRNIEASLPQQREPYDPFRYTAPGKVFLALGEAGPVYVDRKTWRKSHVHVIGTTGAGKGVAAGVMLAQALGDGESVVVLDPKNDEWAPHVLREAAERAGVPFHLVDLREKIPQIDFLSGVSGEELEELLIAGFELSDSGEAADFYRVSDREAAAYTGQALDAAGGCYRSLSEMYESERLYWLADRPDRLKFDDPDFEQRQRMALGAAGFVSRLKELLRVQALEGVGGVSLSDVLEEGGCLYVVGSLRLSRVRTAQKMLFLRLLQLAERRDRLEAQRPVCLFLDEFRYHVSRPALDGLATARDKGLHVIMAHQSLGDLDDTPADLSPKAVRDAVVENAALRIVYRIRDPETAEWLGRMSGQILVDDEARRFDRNPGLAEVVSRERIVRQGERYFFDLNTLLNLPDGWAAVYGAGIPQFGQICPVTAEKRPLELSKSPSPTGLEEVEAIEVEDDSPLTDPVPAEEVAPEPSEEPQERESDPAPGDGEGGERKAPQGRVSASQAGNRTPRLVIEVDDDEPDF
jgi:hypothetical protein